MACKWDVAETFSGVAKPHYGCVVAGCSCRRSWLHCLVRVMMVSTVSFAAIVLYIITEMCMYNGTTLVWNMFGNVPIIFVLLLQPRTGWCGCLLVSPAIRSPCVITLLPGFGHKFGHFLNGIRDY